MPTYQRVSMLPGDTLLGWVAGMWSHRWAKRWCPVDGSRLACPLCGRDARPGEPGCRAGRAVNPFKDPGGAGVFRTAPFQAELWEAGLAVRRDWPDGAHEFVRSCRDPARAARELEGDREFWRRGPMRPELSLVEISRHEFRLHARHRRDCRAPDCARAKPVALEVAA
jgi:hypothetical protein